MVKKWNITIPQLSDEERRVYVYLPDSYRRSQKRYPVLYMFDGHNLFFDSDATYGKSWGLKNYLDKNRTQLIVVAVECSHKANNGRLSEYSPFDFSDEKYGVVEGRGSITMDWLAYELKPTIDSKFRTKADRAFTFIGGSSMGGLMAIYGLADYNHIFSRAIALSPSLWVEPKQLTELLKQADMKPDSVLYMDYGEKELQNHKGMRRIYGTMMNQLYKKNIMLTSRMIPHGVHSEASWEKQLPFAIGALMYN